LHFVIASAAKQSRAACAEAGLLRGFAPRNDEQKGKNRCDEN
jgi:hypothetical protein